MSECVCVVIPTTFLNARIKKAIDSSISFLSSSSSSFSASALLAASFTIGRRRWRRAKLVVCVHTYHQKKKKDGRRNIKKKIKSLGRKNSREKKRGQATSS